MAALNSCNPEAYAQALFRWQQISPANRQSEVGPALEPDTCQEIPEGSLIVADQFVEYQSDAFSHGEHVERAARSQGFQGPVFTMRTNGGPVSANQEITTFCKPGTSAEDMRKGMRSYGKNSALSALKTGARTVANATSSGARNSVLNISAGKNVARMTYDLYTQAVNGSKSGEGTPDRVFADNIARAYQVDFSKLNSADADVAGPERIKLQEAMAKDLGAGAAHKDVGRAKAAFATEVARFESGRNSLVIAIGNAGEERKFFRDHAGQRDASFPKGFEVNLLETPDATMVGATNGAGGNAPVADYNARAKVEIYANGNLQGAGTGTSFAAPRVAAIMAKLHKEHPDYGSEQIEALMQVDYADPGGNGSYYLR